MLHEPVTNHLIDNFSDPRIPDHANVDEKARFALVYNMMIISGESPDRAEREASRAVHTPEHKFERLDIDQKAVDDLIESPNIA